MGGTGSPREVDIYQRPYHWVLRMEPSGHCKA